MLRAVILTQYRRVTDRQTDGQTDGIAIASTALAMRALRRAVNKSVSICQSFVSDIAIFVLKRDVKLQLTNHLAKLRVIGCG